MQHFELPTLGLTEEEHDYVSYHLKARRELPADQRDTYGTPDQANLHFWISVNWNLGRIWQDRPYLMLAGSFAILWLLAASCVHLARLLFG